MIIEPGNIVAEDHTPSTLLVWPRKQRCAECVAERFMAGIFPLTEWQMPDGHIVVDCEGRGEDPRPHSFLIGL